MAHRRHLWSDVGSGTARCRRCDLFRVSRRKPGNLASRVVVTIYERRDPDGIVLETLQASGPCPEPAGQVGIFDLERFE